MSLQEFYRGNHALLLYISTDDRTADGFRYHTTVPGRAAYRSSVLTPPTSFNSSHKDNFFNFFNFFNFPICKN